jgi:hypothetical protein
VTINTRTLDTILESSETIRLANQLGQDRDDWRTRAEAAEALNKALEKALARALVISPGFNGWPINIREWAIRTDITTHNDIRTLIQAALQLPEDHV